MSQNTKIWVGLTLWFVCIMAIWHWAMLRGATPKLIGGALVFFTLMLVIICASKFQRAGHSWGKKRPKGDKEAVRKPWENGRPE